MNSQDMAKLFDVDLESALNSSSDSDLESSDYSTKGSDKNLQSFKNMVEYVKNTLDHEEDSENEIISKARENAKQGSSSKSQSMAEESDDEMEIPGDILKEVDADIALAAAETQEYLNQQKDSEKQVEKQAKATVKAEKQEQAVLDNDNPLELSGEYLKAFNEIRQKYPQFVLHDGNRVYKNFYRFKVIVLTHILKEFPVLDIDDMSNELSEINLRQFVSSDEVSPDVIRGRIDDVYRQKVRLAELMMQCYHQYFVWERELEMLKSKLWKDHELKGSHRRDGLTLEHLFDLEQYYNRLKGFMEASKIADATLKAASDSLSRQLTCLQMREQINVPSHAYDEPPVSPIKSVKAKDKKSHLEPDVILDGSVIMAPKPGVAATPVNFGVDQGDDIIALLG